MVTTLLLSTDGTLAAPTTTRTGSKMFLEVKKRVPLPGEGLEFHSSLMPAAYPTTEPQLHAIEHPSKMALPTPRESPMPASSTVSPESGIGSPGSSPRVGNDSSSHHACPPTEELPNVLHRLPSTRLRGIRQPRRAEVWDGPLSDSQVIALRRQTTDDSRRCAVVPSVEDAQLALLRQTRTPKARGQPVTLSHEQTQAVTSTPADGSRQRTHPWQGPEAARGVDPSSQNLVARTDSSPYTESTPFLPPISQKHSAHTYTHKVEEGSEDGFSSALRPEESPRMCFAVKSRRNTAS